MRILKLLIRSSHKVVNLGYYVATECLILKTKIMTPKEKAEAIVNKMFVKLGGSFSETAYTPLTYKETKLYDNAKKVCYEMATEILTSFVINLTDYQTAFWIEVQKEIEKL